MKKSNPALLRYSRGYSQFKSINQHLRTHLLMSKQVTMLLPFLFTFIQCRIVDDVRNYS